MGAVIYQETKHQARKARSSGGWVRIWEAGRLLTEGGMIMSLPEVCSLPPPPVLRADEGHSSYWWGSGLNEGHFGFEVPGAKVLD